MTHGTRSQLQGKTLTVLLVDDDPGYRYLLRDDIQEMDPEVEIVEAACGEEALSFFPGLSVQVMVLDYEMPGINGAQVLKELKKRDVIKIAIGLTRYGEPVLSEMRDSCALAAFCKDERHEFLTFLKQRLAALRAA